MLAKKYVKVGANNIEQTKGFKMDGDGLLNGKLVRVTAEEALQAHFAAQGNVIAHNVATSAVQPRRSYIFKCARLVVWNKPCIFKAQCRKI